MQERREILLNITTTTTISFFPVSLTHDTINSSTARSYQCARTGNLPASSEGTLETTILTWTFLFGVFLDFMTTILAPRLNNCVHTEFRVFRLSGNR